MKIKVKDIDKFKVLLVYKGYSFGSLSREVGVSRNHITLIANGKSNPSASVAKKIVETLDGTFDDIFFIESVSKK